MHDMISYVFHGAKASQSRIEALRRRLSNQANSLTPEPDVAGAPHVAQSAGHFSAGNPDGQHYPNPCDSVPGVEVASTPEQVIAPPTPTTPAPTAPANTAAPTGVVPADTLPEQPGTLEPEASVAEGEPDMDSVSNVGPQEDAGPKKPYWKFPDSIGC